MRKFKEQMAAGEVSIHPMAETVRKSKMIMHIQESNIQGTVFGGHLMRIAFDNSFLTAALFQRSADDLEL